MIPFDVERVRREFPILSRSVNGRPLVYLDNAATSQKPREVIETIRRYYEFTNSNVHRGLHKLSEDATAEYEAARAAVAEFIGAPDDSTLAFTNNTTEALNLAARGWAEPRLKPGDTILLTESEHHSNMVPWQEVAHRTGAIVRYARIGEDGRLDLDDFAEALNARPKVAAFSHASNVLGTIFPIREMCRLAREAGAVTVVDGAQGAPHLPVDVGGIGCDFYALSSHKMCGPTGVGTLWGRRERMEETEPLLFGGSMISRVTYEGARWADPPYKFEAGTPNIAGAIGFAAAVRFLTRIGMPILEAYERELTEHGLRLLREAPDLRILGPTEAADRLGVFSFTVEGVHPHDVSQIVDESGVAIRAGHHCCEPLHRKLGVTGSARASLYLYNTREELGRLVEALARVRQVFAIAT